MGHGLTMAMLVITRGFSYGFPIIWMVNIHKSPYVVYFSNKSPYFPHIFSITMVFFELVGTPALSPSPSTPSHRSPRFAWAKAVQLTPPTTATVGLSLTIPLSVLADVLRQKYLTPGDDETMVLYPEIWVWVNTYRYIIPYRLIGIFPYQYAKSVIYIFRTISVTIYFLYGSVSKPIVPL